MNRVTIEQIGDLAKERDTQLPAIDKWILDLAVQLHWRTPNEDRGLDRLRTVGRYAAIITAIRRDDHLEGPPPPVDGQALHQLLFPEDNPLESRRVNGAQYLAKSLYRSRQVSSAIYDLNKYPNEVSRKLALTEGCRIVKKRLCLSKDQNDSASAPGAALDSTIPADGSVPGPVG